MKALLIAEYRENKLRSCIGELIAFAETARAESVMFLVGSDADLPGYQGTLYLADVEKYGEYNPTVHRDLILSVMEKEDPDLVVFSHSSYGWDLAPRVAFRINAAQVSEVVDIVGTMPVVPVCNGKLHRNIHVSTEKAVYTLQAGAFSIAHEPKGVPHVEKISIQSSGKMVFAGYEEAEKARVDLTKAEVIVSAGRGVGKPENIELIAALAEALNGDYGASRPVVDAGWVEHNRQVGTTGQTVAPQLYIACGISGAIQHLAGMKKSEFIVAVNTDRDAPIAEIADVLVVADLKKFVPTLTENIKIQ